MQLPNGTTGEMRKNDIMHLRESIPDRRGIQSSCATGAFIQSIQSLEGGRMTSEDFTPQTPMYNVFFIKAGTSQLMVQVNDNRRVIAVFMVDIRPLLEMLRGMRE